jgi:hypothetical protein
MEVCLVQAYYLGKGITITGYQAVDFDTKFEQQISACREFDCPAGYTMYVQVRDDDVERMIELGFRHIVLRCAPSLGWAQPYGCR